MEVSSAGRDAVLIMAFHFSVRKTGKILAV
jgi:hypothetical protein